MLPRLCGLSLFLLAGAFTVPALAEAGNPYAYFVFEGGDELPRNTLVPMHGANGVPFGFKALRSEKPRLLDGKQSIALKIVDSFDDLEGHTTPFPGGDSGYGQSLILFAPAKPLRAKTLYSFMIGKLRLTTLRIGAELDHEPPAWARAPFVTSRSKEETFPSTLVTSITDQGKLPFFVVVELEPLQSKAPAKRMIATIVPRDPEKTCDGVTIHDHEKGVYSENLDDDLGQRYLARLVAVDIAGNRRRAPGDGVPIIWSGSVTVCNDPTRLPAETAAPAPLRWLGPPQARLVADASCHRTDAPDLPCVLERIEAAVEASTPLFVEVRLSAAGARTTRHMTVTEAPSKLAALPPDERCVRPSILNVDHDKMPTRWRPLYAQVTFIDTLGRRSPQPDAGIPLFSYQAFVELCFVGKPTAAAPADASPPLWRGAPRLQPNAWKDPLLRDYDVLLVDFDAPGWTYVRLENKGFEWSAALGPGPPAAG